MKPRRAQINKTNKVVAELESIEAGGLHGQVPIIWESARDCIVTDIFGNRYIDWTSCIFVTNAGHGAVQRHVATQNRSCIHSYTYPTITKLNFLRKLKRFLPGQCERIFLASAGSEVTSWAVQLMRHYTKKPKIIHFAGAFHGKVGAAAELHGQDITITVEDWSRVQAELAFHIDQIGGIMIETYEGWSAKFHDIEFIQQLVAWAKQRDIPVCFDEIQAGFWRTGRKFGYEWYGVEPDLICMGKALGNGVPLSALAGAAKYFDGVPGLSSTHSGNPLVCAAGYGALYVYNNMNEAYIQSKSDLLFNGLERLATDYSHLIEEINGRGLLAAVVCKSTDIANQVCQLCANDGLLVVKTGRESIKIGPPLIIEPRQIRRGLTIMSLAFSEL